MNQVFGLFPTPLMKVEQFLPLETVTVLRREVISSATQTNAKSELLTHSEINKSLSKKSFVQLSNLVMPKVVEFGFLLFGENLRWSIKETWVNILETGGYQSLHAHANSFISGVFYLTGSHPSANTVFHKSMGGSDFVFSNLNENANTGPFNGAKWTAPQINPGDLILFPSYLLHEVPFNQGDTRISVAFNAIPDRLDSWGYKIKFS